MSFAWKLKIWNHFSPFPAFSRLWNDRPDHLRCDGGREELHAGLGAQLSLLELRARLRRSRHDVRHCRPLSRRSADNAAERTGTGPARKAGVSYGALSLGGKSVDAHSYIPDLNLNSRYSVGILYLVASYHIALLTINYSKVFVF